MFAFILKILLSFFLAPVYFTCSFASNIYNENFLLAFVFFVALVVSLLFFIIPVATLYTHIAKNT